MPTVIDHVIQGTVSNGDKIDFAKEKLNVQAFIKGQEVAHADVDASGRYKLTFRSGEERPTTELRVTVPKPDESEGNLASAEIVMPTEFVTTGNQASVQRNLTLHIGPFEDPMHRTLPIFGQVLAQVRNHLEPQSGLRLDFFTFQACLEPQVNSQGVTQTVTVLKKLLCCSSFTAPDGTYAGHFTYALTYKLMPHTYFMVDISQFFNGDWNKVYSKTIDPAQLGVHGRYDFVLPENTIILQPVVTAPATGFRFGTLGLIPCDDVHFVKGYVFSQPEDVITSLTRRPLRGVLRIFGLFAPGSQAAKYRFEIAETTEDHTPAGSAGLTWKELTDPIINHKWDPLARVWQPEVMGPDTISHVPDPITHLPDTTIHVYRNIDTEPEFDWMEHALKFEWNSANNPDGFYVLRITGLDQNNSAVQVNGQYLVVEMPVLRIDNSLPQVEIQAVNALECGKVGSANGMLQFNITAYDPQGHVLSWYIRTLAGRDAIELDSTAVQLNPPADTGAPGVGVPASTPETVNIVKLPPSLEACDPLVYNFELKVFGSAITGYPHSEVEVRDDASLIVTTS